MRLRVVLCVASPFLFAACQDGTAPTGTATSTALGINAKGDVVGRSGTKAVRWKISPVRQP